MVWRDGAIVRMGLGYYTVVGTIAPDGQETPHSHGMNHELEDRPLETNQMETLTVRLKSGKMEQYPRAVGKY